MTAFSADTVQTLIKLRSELADCLKCSYCGNILKEARTVNCPHHLCKECAIIQSNTERACKQCNCTYYQCDISDNLCINNIIDTFHDLATTIERAARLMNIETDGKYPLHCKQSHLDNDNDNESESASESEPEHEQNTNEHTAGKKRKRAQQDDEDETDEAEPENVASPQSKKRKLMLESNHSALSHTPDTAMIDAMEHRTKQAVSIANGLLPPEGEEEEEEEEEEDYWVPSQICITGYDSATTAKFEGYAGDLGIELAKKWAIGSTDILISKSNITNSKPNITFKVLASILCDIPVVKESFLEHSHEKRKMLDFKKYICNYRRVGNQALFEGLSILFATTNMSVDRLRTLLTLGKAKILETKEEIQDQDASKSSQRIMICSHEIDQQTAKQLSEEYNCRVISESWVIKCIYPDEDGMNQSLCLTKKPVEPIPDCYAMEPIKKALPLEEFDQTLKSWDDEESSDADDDDEEEGEGEGEREEDD